MQRIARLTFVFTLILSGCGFENASNMTTYGVGAGVAGAGAGAIVGSVIANGDVVASALLGAGVGVGSGLLIGYWLDEREKARALEVRAAIQDNEREIRENQEEINALSRQVHSDSQRDELDDDSFIHIYQGPSIGVYQ